MKAVRPVIASNGVPYLQMMLHSTPRREEERKAEKMVRVGKDRKKYSPQKITCCPWSHGLRPKKL